LTDDEFEELGLLGNRLNRNQIQENKNKKKNLKIKINKKLSIKNLLKIAIKKIIYSLKWLIKKILNKSILLSIKLKEYLEKQKQLKSNKIAYKIIEIKKEKRNKVIIIRKRVPINYIINTKIRMKNPSIFYCDIDSEEIKNVNSEIVTYDKLKNSIWDFPIKR